MQPYEDPQAVEAMLPGILASEIEQENTMGAVAKRQPATTVQAEVITTGPATIMEVISRAATDPSTDVDKLDRLLAMYERISDREAKAAYADALALMQPELPEIVERGGIKNANKEVQSTYALWEDINREIKPILAKHGFALSFRVERIDGLVSVTGVLEHRAGHRESTTLSLPVDSSGSKNAVQAVGSSTSYGQRYTAKLLLNLTSRGADDDGKAAGQPGRKSAAQAKRDGDHEKIIAQIEACNTERELNEWFTGFDKLMATLPLSWRDPMLDVVERRRNDILDGAGIR